MANGSRAWRLGPELYVAAPADTAVASAIDTVFGPMIVNDFDKAALAQPIRLEAKPADDSEIVLHVDSIPLVRLRLENSLPPFIEGLLQSYAIRTRTDCVGFHAGVVEMEECGILLLGRKGSGKSTLASALAEEGAQYLGDEAAFMRLRDGRFEAFPKAAAIKEGSFSLFPENATYVDPARGMLRYYQPPNTVKPFETATNVGLIVLPSFKHDGEMKVTRLAPHETALMFVQQSFGGLGRRPETLDVIASLSHVPAFQVEYPSATSAVEAIWNLLES